METDEILDDDFEDDEVGFAIPSRKKPGRNDRGTRPVENAADCPFFHEFENKKARDSISFIKVMKLDKPNKGYQGRIPRNSTEETIIEEFGPGLYHLEGCNDRSETLLEQHDVRIAAPRGTNETVSQGNGQQSYQDSTKLLEIQNEIADKNSERQEKTHREVMGLMKDQTDKSQGVLQDFFKQTQSTQGAFYEAMQANNQAMMAQQGQMFQQTMTLMTLGHQQQMEMMRASAEKDKDQNNPLLLAQILIQGLQMGKEIGSEQDQDPWLTGLSKGGDMLNTMLQLKLAGMPGTPTQLLQNPDAIGVPQAGMIQNPQLPQSIPPAPTGNPQTENQPVSKKKFQFTKEELKKIADLKISLDQKGVDFSQVLDQIQIVYSEPEEEKIPSEDENQEKIPDENESERSSESDFEADTEETEGI
jgi:hypothetical protein